MTGREGQRDVEAAADSAIVAELRDRVLRHPDWTREQITAGLGDAVKAAGPPTTTQPDPDGPSPLEQMTRAAELIRRRRITLICPTGRAGEFREAFAAVAWGGLVEVVESDLLLDDGAVYVTRPGLLDIPDVGWPAPWIGGVSDE